MHQVLIEATIKRLFKHMKGPFALITAFRGEYSTKENRRRNKELGKELQRAGYGFVKVRGAWEEVPAEYADVPREEIPNELVKEVKEDTYFVIKPDHVTDEQFKDFIHHLVKKYDQEAAVIGFGEGKGIYLLWQNGKLEKIGSRPELLDDDDIESIYTRFHGYRFKFKRRRVGFVRSYRRRP